MDPGARGPAQRRLGGTAILTASPGALVKTGGGCTLAGNFAAACPIGKGRALVIADADWLNVGTSKGLDGPTDANLDVLVDRIDSLRR